ncbi:hypothetical protein ACA910_020722 [Epithemia clementina (nom. ined.)]
MDGSGNLRLNPLSDSTPDGGIVTFVSSPGTPSTLLEGSASDPMLFESGPPATLTCRGATMESYGATSPSSSSTTEQCRLSLATSTLVASSIVLDGITNGDVEAGLRDSRHGLTLSAIFRAKLSRSATDEADGSSTDEGSAAPKQTLLLPILTEQLPLPEDKIINEVESLFSVAALEAESSRSFSEIYDLKIIPYTYPEQIKSFLAEESVVKESKGPLSMALVKAHRKAKASISSSGNLDMSPAAGQSMVLVGNVHSKLSRTVRAKLAFWKTRVARGLVIDGFGAEAEALLQYVFKKFDAETIMAAGLPRVGVYRMELRSKLKSLVEQGILEAFDGQIENLEKTTLKRLDLQLLKTVGEPAEAVMDSNAAALRNEAFAFEAAAGYLEVPSLGLTKVKAVREMSAKLNDAVMRFPDGAAAKIKRMGDVKKVVRKDKKPGSRAFDIGLDLVAVLRPDGFGSLQGFAGYQLGGNSLTFGIHNDADDPQVIAQFGGVRPPLLRIQPKLRLDVEL